MTCLATFGMAYGLVTVIFYLCVIHRLQYGWGEELKPRDYVVLAACSLAWPAWVVWLIVLLLLEQV